MDALPRCGNGANVKRGGFGRFVREGGYDERDRAVGAEGCGAAAEPPDESLRRPFARGFRVVEEAGLRYGDVVDAPARGG